MYIHLREIKWKVFVLIYSNRHTWQELSELSCIELNCLESGLASWTWGTNEVKGFCNDWYSNKSNRHTWLELSYVWLICLEAGQLDLRQWWLVQGYGWWGLASFVWRVSFWRPQVWCGATPLWQGAQGELGCACASALLWWQYIALCSAPGWRICGLHVWWLPTYSTCDKLFH